MKKYITLLFPALSLAGVLPPTPFPVFLKPGFSSILEFETPPVRVVLGDSQSFQVERLEKSIVIKTRSNAASTNMFVYFRDLSPRLFVLTASDEAEPTYFKRFEANPMPAIRVEPPKPTTNPRQAVSHLKAKARVTQTHFDEKKDYLVVSIEIAADSKAEILPEWDKTRLVSNGKEIHPIQLWAERKEVQRDSRVKARFVFVKPNIARDLKGVFLSLPTQNGMPTYSLSLLEGVNR